MKQVTLNIPDDLLPTYERFQRENGLEWASAYVVEKLKELELRLWDDDAKAEYEKVKPRPNRRDEV